MNDREKWRERVRDIHAGGRHDDDDDTYKNISPFIYLIYTQVVLKERIHVSHSQIMHILFHEQAVYRRDTKWKKAYLTIESI